MGKHKSETTSHWTVRRILHKWYAYESACFMHHFLVFIFCLSCSEASSNSYFIDSKQREFNISEQLEIYQNTPADITVLELANGQLNDQFLPLNDLEGPLSTHAYHWARINLTNQLPKTETSDDFVLEFSLILTDIEIFTVHENGDINKSKSGFFTPFQERSFHPTHKRNLLRLSLPRGGAR